MISQKLRTHVSLTQDLASVLRSNVVAESHFICNSWGSDVVLDLHGKKTCSNAHMSTQTKQSYLLLALNNTSRIYLCSFPPSYVPSLLFYQGQFVLFKSSWLRGLLLKFNWIIKVETLRKHWPFSLPSVDVVHWSYGYISPLHIWIWSDMDTSFMYAITTVCEFIISDILLCAQKKNMFLYSSITFPLTLPGSPYYNPLVFGWRGVVYIIFSFFKQYK